MAARDSKTLFAVALAGFAFLTVAAVGTFILVIESVIGANDGWAFALPGVAAGALAAVAGAAGYILAREHSKTALQQEGLVVELESEFDELRSVERRLLAQQSVMEDRQRIDAETLKAFVKEQRSAAEQAMALIERQRATIQLLEARIAELERAVAPKGPVRVEVSR